MVVHCTRGDASRHMQGRQHTGRWPPQGPALTCAESQREGPKLGWRCAVCKRPILPDPSVLHTVLHESQFALRSGRLEKEEYSVIKGHLPRGRALTPQSRLVRFCCSEPSYSNVLFLPGAPCFVGFLTHLQDCVTKVCLPC